MKKKTHEKGHKIHFMQVLENILTVLLVSFASIYRLPQIALTIQTGDVSALSACTLWANLTYSLLYILYGVVISKMTISAIGLVTSVQSLTMIILFYRFQKTNREEEEEEGQVEQDGALAGSTQKSVATATAPTNAADS